METQRNTGVTTKRGKPAFAPTDEQRATVRELSSYGAPQALICTFIKGPNGKPICVTTLAKHFAIDLEHGIAIATAKVAAALFKDALNGNTTAQIFWLKCRGKGQWNDRQTVELTGANGEPLMAPVPPSITVLFEEGPGDVLAKLAASGSEGGNHG